jgi:hypothetical protein
LATARRADAACVEGVGDLVTILFQATLSRLAVSYKGLEVERGLVG